MIPQETRDKEAIVVKEFQKMYDDVYGKTVCMRFVMNTTNATPDDFIAMTFGFYNVEFENSKTRVLIAENLTDKIDCDIDLQILVNENDSDEFFKYDEQSKNFIINVKKDNIKYNILNISQIINAGRLEFLCNLDENNIDYPRAIKR